MSPEGPHPLMSVRMEILDMYVLGVEKKGHIRRACKQKEVNAGGVHPSRRGVQVVQEESADL